MGLSDRHQNSELNGLAPCKEPPLDSNAAGTVSPSTPPPRFEGTLSVDLHANWGKWK